MTVYTYRGDVLIKDGFGYSHVDIVAASNLENVLVVTHNLEPPQEGVVVGIYDGQYELDQLVPGNLLYLTKFPLVPYWGNWITSEAANTIWTIAIRTKDRGVLRWTYAIGVWR